MRYGGKRLSVSVKCGARVAKPDAVGTVTLPANTISYSYLQIAVIFVIMCAILIPVYFMTNSMVVSSNQILSVQNYIYGKALTASASTISIKCLISVCQSTKLSYNIDFVDRSQIENIVRDISSFPELSDFYNNKLTMYCHL